MKLGRGGFTLLEVMFALIIFTLIIISMIGAMSTGIIGAADSENMRLALNVAQAKMEAVTSLPLSLIVNSGPTADPTFPILSVKVNVTGVDPKTINVVVSWNVLGGSASVTVTTIKAQL